MVKRLLEKYPSKEDKTHLLYLLTQLREGELPLSELSRENLRSVIGTTLKVEIPTWPQFDSICQRFDPHGKVCGCEYVNMGICEYVNMGICGGLGDVLMF